MWLQCIVPLIPFSLPTVWAIPNCLDLSYTLVPPGGGCKVIGHSGSPGFLPLLGPVCILSGFTAFLSNTIWLEETHIYYRTAPDVSPAGSSLMCLQKSSDVVIRIQKMFFPTHFLTKQSLWMDSQSSNCLHDPAATLRVPTCWGCLLASPSHGLCLPASAHLRQMRGGHRCSAAWLPVTVGQLRPLQPGRLLSHPVGCSLLQWDLKPSLGLQIE